jgi:hypothetical protein
VWFAAGIAAMRRRGESLPRRLRLGQLLARRHGGAPQITSSWETSVIKHLQHYKGYPSEAGRAEADAGDRAMQRQSFRGLDR